MSKRDVGFIVVTSWTTYSEGRGMYINVSAGTTRTHNRGPGLSRVATDTSKRSSKLSFARIQSEFELTVVVTRSNA